LIEFAIRSKRYELNFLKLNTNTCFLKKTGSKPLLNLVVQKTETIQRIREALRYLISTTTKLDTATQPKRRGKKVWKTELNSCNWSGETATGVGKLKMEWGNCNWSGKTATGVGKLQLEWGNCNAISTQFTKELKKKQIPGN
jgi:hypothetical protein